jgi:hypothetical protein
MFDFDFEKEIGTHQFSFEQTAFEDTAGRISR